MNEEEKQAIKDTKDILKELNKNKDKDFIGRLYYKNKPIEDNLKILLNLIEKQQKEIEKRLKEIDSLYKMLSVKDERIQKLREFKKEVAEIIKYADDTAEPTYWNIRKLLGMGEIDE